MSTSSPMMIRPVFCPASSVVPVIDHRAISNLNALSVRDHHVRCELRRLSALHLPHSFEVVVTLEVRETQKVDEQRGAKHVLHQFEAPRDLALLSFRLCYLHSANAALQSMNRKPNTNSFFIETPSQSLQY